MDHVIIAGAGHAGVQAAESLRTAGHRGPITLLETASDLPYQRPPLSKDHLAEAATPALPLRAAAFYADNAIELVTGTTVVDIDRDARSIALDDGRILAYSALVLALGATTLRPPCPALISLACTNCGPTTTVATCVRHSTTRAIL